MAILNTQDANSSSLLAQIVDEVEKLSNEEKQSLLMKLRKEKLLQKAGEFDAAIIPSQMSEEEILTVCRQVRKELYEERKAGN